MSYFIVFLLLLSLCNARPKEAVLVDTHRIVAVGDIHGDAEKLKTVLYEAKVAEPGEDESKVILKPTWKHPTSPDAPVRTTIVQMGDLIDRGEEDLQCLNILYDLFKQSQGGPNKVVPLMGNHEFLNLQSEFHYVGKNFGGFETADLRRKAFEGIFGDFMRDHYRLMIAEDKTGFIHAGFDSMSNVHKVDELNRIVTTAMRTNDYRNDIFKGGGAVWSRKLVHDAYVGKCNLLKKVLNYLDLDRIVVAHTPQKHGHVGVFCDERLFVVDTGMSKNMYNNPPVSLEVVIDTFQDGDEVYKKVQISEIGKGTTVPLSTKEWKVNDYDDDL